MSKEGRQRRTPVERIEAKIARSVMVTTTRKDRQEAFDAMFADVIENADDATLAELSAAAPEQK